MSATRRSRLTKVRMRTPLTLVVTTAAIALGMASTASAVGPGGWDHLGAGVTPSSPSLNGDALVLNTDLPGQLLVGGKFTNAGGIADADRIASWNGTAWSAISPTALNGDVMAIETAGGFIFAGGIFTNAGGDPNADFLARWNGATWQPFCTPAVPGPSINGTVTSLQAIGGTLYVGGEFLNGAGNANADFLLACDLASGASSDTVATQAFSGPVYALTADSNGRLYAAGNFINLDSNSASDYIASFAGGVWTNLGAGAGSSGLVPGIIRSLTANGTDVYIGTDATNIAAIPQADHIARWDGAAWHAVGANVAGTDGYLPASAQVIGMTTFGSQVYATGQWLNAGGDPTADNIANFDGTSWRPVGSNGSGDGPLTPKGGPLAIVGGVLHAGGSFTSAGGDPQAAFIAKYAPAFVRPSNLISIGKKPRFDKKRGTAVMSVEVPGPGELVLSGKGIKGEPGAARVRAAARPVDAAGTVELTVKPDAKTKKKLKKKGKAKVTANVTFTPTGGDPSTETKKLKLKLKKKG